MFFDADAANAFNKLMPVSVIATAGHDRTLAENLHRDVAQAAFMRAALVDKAANANSAADTLAAVYPELKEFLKEYEKVGAIGSFLIYRRDTGAGQP